MEADPKSARDAEPVASRIAFLFLADRAEVKEGRLYTMGGVINSIAAEVTPINITLGVAVGVVVPAADTPTVLPMAISFRDPSDSEVMRAGWEARVAPRPYLRAGDSIMVPIALPAIIVRFETAGLYSVAAEMFGVEQTRLWFRVSVDPGGVPTPVHVTV